MGSLKLTTASSGSVILSPENTASDVTVTIPATTATMVTTAATQTLTNKTLTSPTLTTPNIDSAQFATVSGTAPLYACRAWVNFNGTGTVAIRASGNVSSITDNGTGDYTVNFTNALADANYSALMTSNRLSGVVNYVTPNEFDATSRTASAYRTFINQNGTAVDMGQLNIAIFR